MRRRHVVYAIRAMIRLRAALERTVLVVFGVGVALVSAVIGLYVSYHAEVAAGASIVLAATAFFVAALIFAPQRGLLASWWIGRARRTLPWAQ